MGMLKLGDASVHIVVIFLWPKAEAQLYIRCVHLTKVGKPDMTTRGAQDRALVLHSSCDFPDVAALWTLVIHDCHGHSFLLKNQSTACRAASWDFGQKTDLFCNFE